jgi:hypothetical protein
MADNLRIWNQLGQTDPKHTKPFNRAGGFRGTALKPIWQDQQMTKAFGPCGEGWGIGEPRFQVVDGHNGEKLVYCTVMVWWATDGEQRCLYGVGGDKIVTYIKANENRPERWENDDEAFKKAFTDAIGNAFKHLGMGADIHMGQFDDNKYVTAMRQKFEEEERQSREPQTTREVLDNLPLTADEVNGLRNFFAGADYFLKPPTAQGKPHWPTWRQKMAKALRYAVDHAKSLDAVDKLVADNSLNTGELAKADKGLHADLLKRIEHARGALMADAAE